MKFKKRWKFAAWMCIAVLSLSVPLGAIATSANTDDRNTAAESAAAVGSNTAAESDVAEKNDTAAKSDAAEQNDTAAENDAAEKNDTVTEIDAAAENEIVSENAAMGNGMSGTDLAEPADAEILAAQSTELEHIELGETINLCGLGQLENIDNIVIFVRFSDSDEYITQTKAGYANQTYNTNSDSLRQYVKRLSYGELDVSTSFFPNENGNYYSVQLSHSADYYKKRYVKTDGSYSEGYSGYSERIERERELVTETLTAVKPQIEAAGLELDDDGDGFVDGLTFVVPTRGAYTADNISHNDLLWPHKLSGMSVSVTLNDTQVTTYNLLGIGTERVGLAGTMSQSSTTVIHEFLHTLGLPDLYRNSSQYAYPMGPWDIMDGGSLGTVNVSAYYQREYLRYGDRLEQITSTTKDITLDVASYEDGSEKYAVILKSSQNDKEFFVVENRKVENASTQKNAGLIVYRINTSVDAGAGNTKANGSTEKDFIFAFRPGEKSFNAGFGTIGAAALSPDNAYGFTSLGKKLGEENSDYDNGIIYYSDGANSGIIVDNLRVNGTKITFDVTFTEEGIQESESETEKETETESETVKEMQPESETVKETEPESETVKETEAESETVKETVRETEKETVKETEKETVKETENDKKDQGTTPSYTPVQQFVIRLYKNILGREADQGGLDAWTGVLTSKKETGAKVSWGFIDSTEFKSQKISNSDYLDVLYQTFLNRAADAGGKAAWLHQLENGVSRNRVFKGFVESDEFKKICDAYGIEQGSITLTESRDQNDGATMFVYRCYKKVLGRAPDVSGLNAWTKVLLEKTDTPEQVAYGFVFSDEYQNKKVSDETYVKMLYEVFLDRTYDQAGLKAWIGQLQKGESRYQVFLGFAYSDEFKKLYESYGL